MWEKSSKITLLSSATTWSITEHAYDPRLSTNISIPSLVATNPCFWWIISLLAAIASESTLVVHESKLILVIKQGPSSLSRSFWLLNEVSRPWSALKKTINRMHNFLIIRSSNHYDCKEDWTGLFSSRELWVIFRCEHNHLDTSPIDNHRVVETVLHTVPMPASRLTWRLKYPIRKWRGS